MAIRSIRPGFGALILAHRRAAQLTQGQLGRRACLPQTYISGIERHDWQPKEHSVLALARALRLRARARDALLIAAGYAPSWMQACVGDDQLLYRVWCEVQYRDQSVGAS